MAGALVTLSSGICSNTSLGDICCSLNGKLAAAGAMCICDPPWHGENCERMAFKPHRGYQPAYGTAPG